MERTRKIMELFGMNYLDGRTTLFENTNDENIFNLQLNEFDNWRIFNYITEMYNHLKDNGKESVRKTKIITDYTKELLSICKLFSLKEESRKHFLLNIIAPKKIKERLNLPFDNFFIDTDIKINDDIRVFGIHCNFMTLDEEEEKEFEKEFKDIFQKNSILYNKKVLSIKVVYATKSDDYTVFLIHDILYDLNNGKMIKKLKLEKEKSKSLPSKNDILDLKNIESIIVSFITNLLLFFNEPRVVTHIVSQPQNNREKRGLIPIPSLIRTKVHFDLENFIEKVYFTGQSHSKLGFAFWVMGHNRQFKSDYYINKKGSIIWIPAHIRGEGLIPPQIFEIVK